jgi:hypothetical protein
MLPDESFEVVRTEGILFRQSEPKDIEYVLLSGKVADLAKRCGELEKELKESKKNFVNVIRMGIVAGRTLKTPIDVIIEPDEPGFIARLVDIPLFGHGADVFEAIDMLKNEIESLYRDLQEDSDFTDEWLLIKKFLQENIQD